MNIKALWNSQADHQNQWDSLGEDEKLEFAMAHEREECAKLCDHAVAGKHPDDIHSDSEWAALSLAQAIRARGKA